MKIIIKALVAGWLALGAVAAVAQTYPAKSIRLIVPYPPGGQSDIVGRNIAQALSDSLGRPVVVENKPGSNGLLGHDFVAKAPADGYTLLVGNSAMLAVTVNMLADLPYDPIKDFAPVIRVGGGAYVLEVNAKVPATSVKELLDLARKDPGKLNYGLGGLGTLPHLLSEQIKLQAGTQWATVAYKGSGPMLVDLLSGQVDFTIDNVASSIEYIRSGRFRALAVSSPTDALPGVPTLEQAGLPGVQATSWHGILAPAGTPPEIVRKLNETIAQNLRDPAMVQKMKTLGIDIAGGSPADFSAFIRSEKTHWGEVVKQTGAKVE